MHLSINELESLTRKAAVGAGLDHGHAGEAARSLLWLTAAGSPAAAMLVRALQAWTGGATSPLLCRQSAGVCRLDPARNRPACPLHAAPALRDFAQLLAAGRYPRIEAARVAQPGWIVGQMAAESWPAGWTIHCLETEGAAPRWRASLTAACSAPTVAGDIDHPDPANLVVTGADARGDAQAPGPARTLGADLPSLIDRGVDVDSADYDALRHYFDLTLVPDSDASRRHGAGAGLVDTD